MKTKLTATERIGLKVIEVNHKYFFIWTSYSYMFDCSLSIFHTWERTGYHTKKIRNKTLLFLEKSVSIPTVEWVCAPGLCHTFFCAAIFHQVWKTCIQIKQNRKKVREIPTHVFSSLYSTTISKSTKWVARIAPVNIDMHKCSSKQ